MIEPAFMDKLVYEDRSHTYRVDGRLVPHITEIVPSDYSHVMPERLEVARQRGSAVHKLTEHYDLDLMDWSKLDKRLEGYLMAWVKAVTEYQIEFDAYDVERRLYHPVRRYAGTGDRPRCWVTAPGKVTRRRLATLEIKSIARMDENVDLQTAGQQYAENYRARAMGIPETEDRWGCQLKPDGTYKMFPYTDHAVKTQVFLSYLVTLNWEIQHGKKQYADSSKRFAPSNGNSTSHNVTRRHR